MDDSLTGFQRDVLTVTSGLEEPHGLKIKAELEASYGKEVNHGRLYPNLNALTNKGLIEKGEIDRRTNSYELSEKGEAWLAQRDDWIRQYRAPEELTA